MGVKCVGSSRTRYPDSHPESGGWKDDLELVPENDNVSLKSLSSSDKLIDHVSGPVATDTAIITQNHSLHHPLSAAEEREAAF